MPTGVDLILYKFGATAAIAAVRRAVKQGKLTDLKDTFVWCVDCKKRQATMYDHRNYNRRLSVSPVCRGCNARRGPAKYKAPEADRIFLLTN